MNHMTREEVLERIDGLLVRANLRQLALICRIIQAILQ